MKPAVVAVSLAASLLLALTGRASAQPGVTPAVPAADVVDEPPARASLPPPAPAPVVVPAPVEEDAPMPAAPPRRSEPSGSQLNGGTAFLLSLGGTTVSWGLLLGGAELPGLIGVVLAPSFGNWYAGRYLTRGLGMRLGGMAMLTVGAVMALGDLAGGYGHGDPPPPEDSRSDAVMAALVIGGLALTAFGTIDDIVSAPANVRKKNRERGYDVGLAPVVTQRSAGLALGGRF
jgi:hypothetical protein